ncbi:carboxynorspermidine decarboxylase [Cohaesibacter celericrescens]|uniref:Carboxynorspermidine/carboxyspermidine decarboxylase n=1 Tax=Cohaesibacter celericrescens TaxID=2067669 RepID=A0A2N5XM71_9HYPH|nr:carboxynorspermidine decarboxylase [Cohaesibacter celericrescens]PLW75585.1 carboxynorspermidine decarboxylase [Cohaesibacter celericrescens]
MDTQAGDAGAFKDFDLSRVPSPCFVVDAAAIRRNLTILSDVGKQADVKVLLALKAFSCWSLGKLVGDYLDGTCASGLWEAKLAREKFSGEVATYSAGFKADEMPEILELSDHLIFNSPAQLTRFSPQIIAAQNWGYAPDFGLRINPEHSEGSIPKYDPCAAGSRLGTPISQLNADDLAPFSGIHMHTLCEQDFAPLKRTFEAVEETLAPWLTKLKWLNFGGGHHITRADYQRDELVDFLKGIKAKYDVEIYLEPGEAVALDAGILIGEVLDVSRNGDIDLAIMDISATCHMPDVIEAPYRPALLGEPDKGHVLRLGGPSCLAGDVIGDYRFEPKPQIGQRIAFLDQAHYSMVKTNTFNGVRLPSIAIWDSETDALEVIRRFPYEEFRDRLS